MLRLKRQPGFTYHGAGSGEPEEIRFTKPTTTMGRKGQDVYLTSTHNAKLISRQHCIVYKNDRNEFAMHVLGLNGVIINGRCAPGKVGDYAGYRHTLAHGDCLAFGVAPRVPPDQRVQVAKCQLVYEFLAPASVHTSEPVADAPMPSAAAAAAPSPPVLQRTVTEDEEMGDVISRGGSNKRSRASAALVIDDDDDNNNDNNNNNNNNDHGSGGNNNKRARSGSSSSSFRPPVIDLTDDAPMDDYLAAPASSLVPPPTGPVATPSGSDDMVDRAQIHDHLNCCVCNELMVLAHNLKCDHSYCLGCITDWMQRQHTKNAKPSCPQCREEINSEPMSVRLLDQLADQVCPADEKEERASAMADARAKATEWMNKCKEIVNAATKSSGAAAPAAAAPAAVQVSELRQRLVAQLQPINWAQEAVYGQQQMASRPNHQAYHPMARQPFNRNVVANPVYTRQNLQVGKMRSASRASCARCRHYVGKNQIYFRADNQYYHVQCFAPTVRDRGDVQLVGGLSASELAQARSYMNVIP